MSAGWTKGPSLNYTRSGSGLAGTQLAAVCAAGTHTLSDYVNSSELFNGTVWAYTGNVNTGRYDVSAAGDASAGLLFGGYNGSYLGASETYNGTVWAGTSSMNLSRSRHAGAGSALAAFAAGGYAGSSAFISTEKFNGTIWTSSGNLTTGYYWLSGCGNPSAGLVAGGYAGVSTTQVFDGSIWGLGGSLNTAREAMSVFGVQSSCLAAGGNTGASLTQVCEQYNGVAWSAVAFTPYNTSSGIYRAMGTGTSTAGMRAGGDTGSAVYGYCELWNTTYTSYSWYTGPKLVVNRYQHAGAGISNLDALAWGGNGYLATSEGYNGTLWTAGGGVPVGRSYLAGTGSAETALSCGGTTGSVSKKSEKYNGTSWTALNDMNTARQQLAAAGNSSAAISFGGYIAADSGVTETFDGTTWSSANALNTARRDITGCGTSTAAIGAGGAPSGSASMITEIWNGTSWSNSGNLQVARYQAPCAGTSISARICAGQPSYLSSTENWTGSAWTTSLSMNMGRNYGHSGGMGVSTGCIVAGGQDNPAIYSVEIYTGAIPVIIASPIFDADSSTVIVQFFPTPFTGTGLAVADGVYEGPFFDLASSPFSGTAEIDSAAAVFAPFDASVYPLGATGSMLADLHITAVISAILPALTMVGTLATRSGSVIQTLPCFTLLADGQIGEVGRVAVYLPGLKLTGSGLTGELGTLALPLPFLTISSTGGLARSAVANLTLPFFYINAHGETKAAKIVFRVLTMNLRNFAVTEYENFDFNSFAQINGVYFGAKADGIYPLVGTSDQGTDIDTVLTTGKAFIEHWRLRDLFSYGLSGGQKRSKLARGLHSGYIDFTIENENGEDLDLDYFEVMADPIRRKKH
jgi:hypothetical protein